MGMRFSHAGGLARNKSIYTPEPCMLCVSARRLGSSQVVAVDPSGFRHRTNPGGKWRGACGVAWVRSCRTRRVCRHLARGHCTGYAIVSPTQAWACGLKTRCSRRLDRQWRACLLLRCIPPLGPSSWEASLAWAESVLRQPRHGRACGVAARASLVLWTRQPKGCPQGSRGRVGRWIS